MTDQERWNANESLLQSYRSIFISSVSFLLAVGAIVAEKSIAVLMAVAVVSVLMIWAIWFRVVRARHLIVDYYMYRSLNGVPKGLCGENDYVHKRDLRNTANKLLKITTNWRPTRWKIDLLIPFLFSVVWIALIVYGWCSNA